MNVYVTVEGTGEKIVYTKWIKFVNPRLRIVNDINEVSSNNVYIISGGGYPQYFDTIENAVRDVEALGIFELLVVSVDSEEMSYDEKYNEIKEFIETISDKVNYKIIIQHFCLETWALGNRNIIPRNPNSELIRKYIEFYDLLLNDPENLPSYEPESLNRAQFALKYLRTVLNDRYRNLTYLKRNPKVISNRKYFNRIKSRFNDTEHIQRFRNFLDAFV